MPIHALPLVTTSQIPWLDNFLKPEISLATKATNKELTSIQTHMLDALAPLTAIIEQKSTSEQTI